MPKQKAKWGKHYVNYAGGPMEVFYMRQGHRHYWGVPAWQGNSVEFMYSSKKEMESFKHLDWDDLPPDIQREYLLWVMSGKIDK